MTSAVLWTMFGDIHTSPLAAEASATLCVSKLQRIVGVPSEVGITQKRSKF
jgi:hypothetical protein